MIPSLAQGRVAMKLFGKTVTLPKGKFRYEVEKVTAMGDAIVTYSIPDATVARDMIGVTIEQLQLAVITKAWKIERDQWDSYESAGKDLPTAAQTSATDALIAAENTLLTKSWKPDGSNDVLKGLYALAGNSYATTADFATYGKAKTAVAQGIALNKADNVVGVNYNLSLNPEQFAELQVSATTGGIEEWPQVMRILNSVPGAPTGEIYENTNLTAGTGLLSPVDPAGKYIRLIVGQDPINVLGEDSKIPDISPIYGTTYEVLAPYAIHPNSLCTLGAI